MENKKEIGKAFREKIDDLKKSPSPKVWESINAELTEKKKRRIVPFWIKTLGIAVVFLILLTTFLKSEWTGDFIFHKGKSDAQNKTDNVSGTVNNNSVTLNSENNKINPEKKNIKLTKDNIKITNNQSSSEKESKETRLKSEEKIWRKNKNIGLKYFYKTSKKSHRNSHLDRKFSAKNNSKETLSQNANSIVAENQKILPSTSETDFPLADKKNDSLKEKKKEIVEDKKSLKDSTKILQNKFYVFGYVSPTYYGLFSNKSILDKRLENTKSSSEIIFNFGGYIGVNLNENVSLRLGLSHTKFNTTTENIIIASPENTRNFENIDYKQGVSNSSIATQFSNSEKIDILEEYSFTEVPFEVKYKIIGHKFGIEAIGGFSTFYLNKNSVTVEGINKKIEIGEMDNLKKVHFSANIGAGFYYKISNRLQFNVEPILKYHLNLSTDEFKKISFGLQTGFQYNLN